MPSLPVFKARRSKRVESKRRASLVINLDRSQKRLPCLVLDSSKEGFRLRSSFRLSRRQVVEIISGEDHSTPCAAARSGSAKPDASRRESRPGNRLGVHPVTTLAKLRVFIIRTS